MATKEPCRYCWSPMHGARCPHCDIPHLEVGCTLCALAEEALRQLVRTMGEPDLPTWPD